MLSTRLAHFELPPQWSTLREATRIEQATGRRIIHMEKGDYSSPEFRPPAAALEAAVAALRNPVRYAPGPGILPLREALAEEMTRRGRPTSPDEVVVTPGAKFGITASLLLLLDDGAEVVMPNPGYPPDEFWARYLRATIRYVRFRDSRNIDTDQLADILSPRTRLLILNTPQRPTGQLVENLDEVAAVLLRFPQVAVVSDEIFSQIVYPPHRHRTLATHPELQDRVVVIDTFSKTYVMTGFRIGWVVAPPPLARMYDIVLQNSCTNVPTFVQEAALAVLRRAPGYVEGLRSQLQAKRDLAFGILSRSRALAVENAQGTFYLCPRLPRGVDDREATRLLLEHGVGVVPGSAFGTGGAGSLRLTFALSDTELAEGVERLVDVADATFARAAG